MQISKTPNGGVDAAARFHSSIAGSVMMRNTPPPLASNDLFGCVADLARADHHFMRANEHSSGTKSGPTLSTV
jgi:hypothetical protein